MITITGTPPPEQSMDLPTTNNDTTSKVHACTLDKLKQLKGEIHTVCTSEVTFPCKSNVCCIPIDILTFCHCFTGSICLGYRPRIYDYCCPDLCPEQTKIYK